MLVEIRLMSEQIIKIQLPDGSVREVARGTTPFDIAMSISPRLAAAVVVARIRPLAVPAPAGETAEDEATEAQIGGGDVRRPQRRASGWWTCRLR